MSVLNRARGKEWAAIPTMQQETDGKTGTNMPQTMSAAGHAPQPMATAATATSFGAACCGSRRFSCGSRAEWFMKTSNRKYMQPIEGAT